MLRNYSLRVLLLGILFSYSIVVSSESYKPFIQKHVLPAYLTFEKSTDFLARRADAYCNTYSNNDFMLLQVSFNNALTAWQSIQHVRFGAIMDEQRWLRIYYWPDSKGEMLAELTNLMVNSERWDGSKDALNIDNQNTAVQGFSALEYLLYGGKTIAGKTCQLMTAISHNLNTIARDVKADWEKIESDGWQDKQFEKQVISSIEQQFVFLIEEKLALISRGNQSAIEARLSNGANAALKANIVALFDAFKWLPKEQLSSDDIDQLTQGFLRVTAILGEINLPLHDVVGDAQQKIKIAVLRKELLGLKKKLSTVLEKGLLPRNGKTEIKS